MFVPTLEAAQITIQLFSEFSDDDSLDNMLKPGNDYVPPEDFLQQHFTQNNYSKELQDLITEFFFRICKYRKYLSVVVYELFTPKIPGATHKCPQFATYLVIIYLLIIELNQYTKNDIEQLLFGLNKKKALNVLNTFKKSKIITKLYQWACDIWDVEYVKSVLENVLNEPLFEEVHETLNTHLHQIKVRYKKKLTVPVAPKCLTRPSKKLLNPMPSTTLGCPFPKVVTRIPILIKASKIPSTTYVPPIQNQELERTRRVHKEKAKKLYEEAQKKAFRVATIDNSEKLKALAKKIEEERMGSYTRKPSSKKVKQSTKAHCPKKTTTVILREGARLLKIEQDEIKRYEDIANGGFNNESISEWEDEIREQIFQQRIEDIEKKHLEGLLSYEEAVLAKQKCLKKKKESADEFRKTKEAWMEQLENWRMEEQLRIQETVRRGKATDKGAKDIMEQLKEEKHRIVVEMNEESRALKERWLKEKEEDLQRKVQLIKEIKALQTFGVMKRKQTDFTETANLGFLCEMSIAELKERLFLMKIDIEEELNKKRAEIKVRKECRKEIIEGYQELIESHQKVMEEQKKRMEEEEEEEQKRIRKKALESPSIEELRMKLYQKRKERMKYQVPA